MTIRARARELWSLLDEHRDMLDERVLGPEPPRWCTDRDWQDYLLSLDDEAVERCEAAYARGLAGARDAPASLRALAERCAELTELPPLGTARDAVAAAPLRRAKPHKAAQVAALAAAIAERATGAARVVDAGAGPGLRPRELARALARPALGLEHVAARVEVASRLTRDARVRFEARDAKDPSALGLSRSDLLVGLHACGDVGDALVTASARSGAALVLVSCCLQKIEPPARAPLSETGRALGAKLPRGLLGLTNLAGRDEGGREAGLAPRRRLARHALHLLLCEHGVAIEPLDEVHGIPRRRFGKELAHVAELAFRQRGLPVPSQAALAGAWARATREQARVRRLCLARGLLARPLELFVVAERACVLEEAGRRTELCEAFPRAVSARNLAIVASAAP